MSSEERIELRHIMAELIRIARILGFVGGAIPLGVEGMDKEEYAFEDAREKFMLALADKREALQARFNELIPPGIGDIPF